MVQFTKRWYWKLINIKDTFAESLQLQMPVLHQSMRIFKAGCLPQINCVNMEDISSSEVNVTPIFCENHCYKDTNESNTNSYIICSDITDM